MKKFYSLLLAIIATLTSISANAQVNHLVISQVYGAGGNSGATYNRDYIELFNPTNAAISLAGYSVQYGSANGTAWQRTNLTGSIPAGGYYLVQGASGATGVAPPAGDAAGTLNLSGTTGKVALVSSTTLLSGSCPTANIVDLVGFGAAPNCKEGATSAPAPSSTNAIFRKNNGCTDTDNNGADFMAAPAAPRNSTSPAYTCSCTAPTNQPTNLSLTPSDVSVAGSFTAADPGTTAANGYLVLRSTSSTLTQQPVSGTSYTAGNTFGNATVVSSGSSTTFNSTGLTPSTTYYFFVYSFATTGTCYNTASPLNNSVTTNAATSSTVFVTSGNAAAEPSTGGSFTVTFSPATTASTDINFNFDGTATFATDYSISFSAGTTTSTTASGTLTVPSGTTSVTVTITPVDDAVVEPTETIGLTLSGATNGYTPGAAAASINLTDNDVAPTASVAAGSAAAEPATNGTFIITLSSPAPAGGVTINYTLAGTATATADYTDASGGSITIPQGSTSGTITLSVLDDAAVEATETISITLNSANNGYTPGTSTASINVTDNDVAPLTPVALNGTYTQDFNSLATTGTTNPMTLGGWAISEAGGGARDNEQYGADHGSSGTGDTYSYGTTSSSDRALGSIASGTLQSSFGVYLANSTGSTINRLKVSYMVEEWRLGTAGRTDRLDFQYSTDATHLTNGTWTNVDQLDALTPNTVTTGQKNGNDPANRALVSYTISGLSIPNGATVLLRWSDPDISGSDDGLAVDSLSIEANPVDAAAPVLVSFSPADNSSGVALSATATLTFNEAVQKGTGTITVTRSSDNVVVQTIDVTNSAVTVSGASASFGLSGLAPSTAYSIQMTPGAFEDLSANDFAGISDNTTWSFTTGSALFTADFQNCSSTLSDGFTQYSTTGTITWACSTFGRDPAAPAGTTSYPNGVQINGFSGGTNVPNVDWLIAPSINLTGTTYPLLSFWSRTAFNGLPLQLKVSTNYTGGDPALATWIDVNGKFPAQTSNVWTLSENINLSAFKQPNVHFAFVYESSTDDGARWTLDDIRIDNSATPPPSSISTSTNDVQYTFVAAGSTSNKTFSFTGNDITSDVTLTSTGNFQLSKDGVTFANSITYTQAEANNIANTVTVRFAPTAANQNSTGTVSINTSGLTSTVNLKGTSIDPVNTLEVVNWNVEWFGSTGYGPTNEAQQEQNVRTILQNIGADIFGLIEIVDETKLAAVVSQMPGYSYVIGNFGSHVNPPDPSGDPVSQAQKLAFVYKTSQFSNVTSRPLINNQNISSTSYYNWSSGRYPLLMNADVTLNGQTKNINFILVHAKANTSPTTTSYARREAAATELHDTLMTYFPTANVIVLGDLNDDLDQSITAGFTTTSWHSFTNDGANFYSPTLPLSLAGKKSTVSYNDIIDHVIVSNDMQQYYLGSTASILTDVSSLVSNYGSTTSDHYPVYTRFAFDPAIILPVKLVNFTAAKQGAAVTVSWSTSEEVGVREFVVERSADGRSFVKIGRVAAAGTTRSVTHYSFTDRQVLKGNNFYRLRVADQDNKTEVSRVVRINFSQSFTVSLSPNPAKGQLLVSLAHTGEAAHLQILDMTGKRVHTARISVQNQAIDIRHLSAGLYLVRVQGLEGVYTEKLVIE